MFSARFALINHIGQLEMTEAVCCLCFEIEAEIRWSVTAPLWIFFKAQIFLRHIQKQQGFFFYPQWRAEG